MNDWMADKFTPVAEIARRILPCDNEDCGHITCEMQREDILSAASDDDQ